MGVCAPQDVGKHVLNTAWLPPFPFPLQEPVLGGEGEGVSLCSHVRHTEKLQSRAEAISTITVTVSLTTRQPYQQVFYKLSFALKPSLRLVLHRILSFI